MHGGGLLSPYRTNAVSHLSRITHSDESESWFPILSKRTSAIWADSQFYLGERPPMGLIPISQARSKKALPWTHAPPWRKKHTTLKLTLEKIRLGFFRRVQRLVVLSFHCLLAAALPTVEPDAQFWGPLPPRNMRLTAPWFRHRIQISRRDQSQWFLAWPVHRYDGASFAPWTPCSPLMHFNKTTSQITFVFGRFGLKRKVDLIVRLDYYLWQFLFGAYRLFLWTNA